MPRLETPLKVPGSHSRLYCRESRSRLILNGVNYYRFRVVSLVTRSLFAEKYERFRKRLVSARKARGLTQVDLARRLARPQSFVSRYERGARRLDVVEFLEVAKAIGSDPFKLLRELEK